ncbi:UPF0183-domain-containing protein [Schizopora paradoxa]|uniref:UPF0183-domain-containing protein n=1 Tax=Schizopora paradoxa TaxID=27342 RepID=A0A0H2S130_9AGAM|nr:UPF0183-domain-containing protein [Schizopora paradoxa]
MTSTLSLDLRPGSGLGIFELGTTLWTVLDLLRQHTTLFPRVDVKFDDSVVDAPVLLHVPPHLDLLFSARDQRLRVVAARRLREPAPPLQLLYRGTVLSSVSVNTSATPHQRAGGPGRGERAQDVVLRRADISNHFGPTYAGDGLIYPGVSFLFDEDGPGGASTTAGKAEDRQREVRRVVVTQAKEEEGAEVAPDLLGHDEVRECPAMLGGLRRAIIRVHDGVILQFYPSTASPVHVRLGYTTAQDLTVDLGSPLRVYYKEDDRMAIHSRNKTPEAVEDGYFYNYFQHGIDFLINGTTHIVQKIILHTNIPGTPMFQRYNRCPWEIEGEPEDEEDDSPPRVKFSEKLDVISRFLNRGSREVVPSMQVDRTEDDRLTLLNSTTRLVGFDGVVLEATESALVVAVTLF